MAEDGRVGSGGLAIPAIERGFFWGLDGNCRFRTPRVMLAGKCPGCPTSRPPLRRWSAASSARRRSAPVQRIRSAKNETNGCALSRLLKKDRPMTLEELERGGVSMSQ